MQFKTVSGATLAAAAAAFVMTGVATVPAAHADHAVKCFGLNACKGHGACKSLGNSCKGQNACKGQGVTMLPKSTCEAKGGKTTRG